MYMYARNNEGMSNHDHLLKVFLTGVIARAAFALLARTMVLDVTVSNGH